MTARATLDSNILVYAALEPQTEKGKRAARTIELASAGGVIAAQALLEFVGVVRRRAPALTAQAIEQVAAWQVVFETAPTTSLATSAALGLVRDHRFQVWDALIWAASRAAGASLFLSEDLQDGLVLGGMRAMNPFAVSDESLVRLLDR
jgi:predicted nucleic acid-binding protein